MLPQIQLEREELKVYTKNLSEWGVPEIGTEVRDVSWVPDAEDLLRYLASYMIRDDVEVAPGDTIARGYWTVQVREEPGGYLSLWEYSADSENIVPGAELTLKYWREQNDVCASSGAEFSPPDPNQLIVFSDGVKQGELSEGVRYPSPEHMSGWWVTTDLYDGDIASLKTEHLYHFTAERPDLSKYIALPSGYRFHEKTGEAWLDEKVSAAE